MSYNITCDPAIPPIQVDKTITTFTASLIDGAILAAICYGVVAIYFSYCFYYLKEKIFSKKTARTQDIVLFAYIIILFTLGTISLVSGYLGVKLFLTSPCSQAGGRTGANLNKIFDVSLVLNILLADMFLVWRCIELYRGSSISAWIFVGFICTLMATSFAVGIYAIVVSFLAYTAISLPYEPAYPFILFGSVSLAHNVAITLMIVTRLMIQRHLVTRALGSQYGTQYTSVISILIESAAFVVVIDIIYLLMYSKFTLSYNIVFLPLGQVQVIAPFTIIFRALRGRSFSASTLTAGNGTSVALSESRHHTTNLSINPIPPPSLAHQRQSISFAIDARELPKSNHEPNLKLLET